MDTFIKQSLNRNRPIGVFDSGLGGLTVVREILERFPNENIIYFGDLARLPYGIKSKRQITEFSCENTEFLLNLGIKVLVIACNSSASAAGMVLRSRYQIPILDVIRPAAREAAQVSVRKRIGIIGTQATIASGSYLRILKSIHSHIQTVTQACPLFVPLAEEGILEGPIAEAVIRKYLEPLTKKKIDTLILGCTHYPLLARAIQKFVGPHIHLVDSAIPTVSDLFQMLEQKNLLTKNSKKGKLDVFVSDSPQNFVKVGERFLGRSFRGVRLVKLTETTTIRRKWAA